MSDFPIALAGIVAWFDSKRDVLRVHDISMGEIHANELYKPSAWADFDATNSMGQITRIGRITFWATGEIYFEVGEVSQEEFIFMRHELIPTLVVRRLNDTFEEFLAKLKHG